MWVEVGVVILRMLPIAGSLVLYARHHDRFLRFLNGDWIDILCSPYLDGVYKSVFFFFAYTLVALSLQGQARFEVGEFVLTGHADADSGATCHPQCHPDRLDIRLLDLSSP